MERLREQGGGGAGGPSRTLPGGGGRSLLDTTPLEELMYLAASQHTWSLHQSPEAGLHNMHSFKSFLVSSGDRSFLGGFLNGHEPFV